jgi:DNA-binding protein HU-beta
MNKAELINAIAKKTDLSKKDTEATLKAFVEVVEKELKKKDGKVQLIGFGTFSVKPRKARMGRNPQKPGEVVKIPASKAPVFKAGKALKEAVNKK